MNRGWYHHSMAHKLASKGIKTKSPFKGAFANGLVKSEFVEFDDLPEYIYHATPTENIEKIFNSGIELGREETRSLEYEWEEVRPVDETIFFTENEKSTGYFGLQAVQSISKRKGKKFSKEDLDYTILRVNTDEFEKSNFFTYLGAELFGTGEREYFVKYKVPRFWIDGMKRVYYDKNKDEIIEESFDITWRGTEYKIIPKVEGWF